ncbi:hypothetical protein [Deinococcus sedimenti]|uniref:Exo-alpha-sialidase n=1 Tax=Deinococcus sedimenti TaxID=1867090 RepID=A0ABQ2S771_9DEIO|nr:hypothetical protein [Deinococcus sedimenti]GGS03909.1 hypothetical protein GCM10008960_33120 [Deinococcus sedimenti]
MALMRILAVGVLLGGALLSSALAGGGNRPALRAVPWSAPPLSRQPVRDLQVAAAPDGGLLLATIQDDRRGASWRGAFQGRAVRLQAWAAGRWAPVGDILNYDQPRPVSNLDLRVDAQGTPVMVWNENYGDNDVIVFRAFRSGAWTDWRTRYLGVSSPAAARTRAVGALNGEPVLIHGEYRRNAANEQQTWLTYRTWGPDGQWTRSAPLNRLDRFSRSPALALTARGPLVAYLEGEVLTTRLLVRAWRDGRWTALGGPVSGRAPTYLASPRLVLQDGDRPTVAWIEGVPGRDAVFVAAWTGAQWAPQGGPVNAGQATDLDLLLDSSGHPVVAWTDEQGSLGRVLAARWDGLSWSRPTVLNVNPTRDARTPRLARLAGGEVILAWREDRDGRYGLQVRQLQW